MHKEAQRFNLRLKVTSEGFGLFTTKALREGDMVCDMSTLWFDNIRDLKHILSQEGNKALLDKLVRIEGVYTGDTAMTYYGIRVGCAAFIRHYLGNRKGGPNAKLAVNTSAGFTGGLMTVEVSTRNNLGIAQDTEIFINYGQDYDFESVGDIEESPTKKFKGQVASLFENQSKGNTGNTKDQGQKRELSDTTEEGPPQCQKKIKLDEAHHLSTSQTGEDTLAANIAPGNFNLVREGENLRLVSDPTVAGWLFKVSYCPLK